MERHPAAELRGKYERMTSIVNQGGAEKMRNIDHFCRLARDGAVCKKADGGRMCGSILDGLFSGRQNGCGELTDH